MFLNYTTSGINYVFYILFIPVRGVNFKIDMGGYEAHNDVKK
ncbi:hypothetical protein M2419_004794 [Sphingobacterium sp. BIGb0116]|nr:hypothetical protein [Sphingobacterium sp. BIGb0116]